MKRITMLSAMLPSFVLASCGDNPTDSLVGAWKIAPDSDLAQEDIGIIFRKEDGDYPITLSYLLSPSGLVRIEKGRDHVVCCHGGIDNHVVDGRQQAQLSKGKQIEVRRMLARLRPQTLSSDGSFALPQGCSFTFDSRPWNSISFSRGKVIGAFIFQPDCKGAGADRARYLLRSVVAALPPVEGSKTFFDGH